MTDHIERNEVAEPIAADQLPLTFRNFDMNAAVLDVSALREIAGCIADAWQAVQETKNTEKRHRERLGALVWLSVELCDHLSWKLDRLDTTHRLVARADAGPVGGL